MAGRFDIQRCYTCGANEFEQNMRVYNDHFFCSIRCKTVQERKDDDALNRIDCASDVLPSSAYPGE
jgi:hypothetical protein